MVCSPPLKWSKKIGPKNSPVHILPYAFFSHLFIFCVYFVVTNDISILPAFKTSGEFSITNSLKFGFSLFCRVLFLAFFVPVFISCSFVFFKKKDYDEYFAYGSISESNNYYLYTFMTSLRREPIRGHKNCPIATIWCRIKCVLTKNSLFKQFFPSKQF